MFQKIGMGSYVNIYWKYRYGFIIIIGLQTTYYLYLSRQNKDNLTLFSKTD